MKKLYVYSAALGSVMMVSRFIAMSPVISTLLFITILILLTISFARKDYDQFLVTWLAFYFASPLLQLPFTEIGGLGILNGIFIFLMILQSRDAGSRLFAIIGLLVLLAFAHPGTGSLRLVLSRLFMFISPLVFFFYSQRLAKDIEGVLTASVVIALVNLPLAIYQAAIHPVWGTVADWRGTRIYGNLFWPNSYSVYLIPVLLYLYYKMRRDASLPAGIAFVALLFADIMTYSRAGMLGLIAGIAVLEIVAARRKMLIVAGLSLIALFYAANMDLLEEHLTPATISERTNLWDDITPGLEGNMLLGSGIGSYESFRENVPFQLSTHNTYITLLFEIGLAGLLLIVYFIVFAIARMHSASQGIGLPALGVALGAALMLVNLVGEAGFSQVVSLNSWISLGLMYKVAKGGTR